MRKRLLPGEVEYYSEYYIQCDDMAEKCKWNGSPNSACEWACKANNTKTFMYHNGYRWNETNRKFELLPEVTE